MKFIPSHVQIEPVNRFCDARCPMCTIKFVPDWEKTVGDDLSHKGVTRNAEIMTQQTFETIASKFKPYVDNIKILSLHGCGESLLDKGLYKKIAFAKEIGFREVGFTSNCNALTNETAERLLDAGLNCIIPSIDGVTKAVHEEIRPRIDYERIVANLRYFVEYRNKHKKNCKLLVRMVKQKKNSHQWDEYEAFWRGILNPDFGDDVLGVDIHNTGGKVENYDNMKVEDFGIKNEEYENHYKSSVGNVVDFLQTKRDEASLFMDATQLELAGVCPDLFTRFSIFVSGEVALCSSDQAGYFPMGNVITDDPIEIFNNQVFAEYRQKWLSGRSHDCKHCDTCTLTVSRYHKSYLKKT